MGLPQTQPGIVIVDNAPSHLNILTPVLGGMHGWDHLYRFSDTLMVILTIKNRSHALNSGDQLVNRSLRQV